MNTEEIPISIETVSVIWVPINTTSFNIINYNGKVYKVWLADKELPEIPELSDKCIVELHIEPYDGIEGAIVVSIHDIQYSLHLMLMVNRDTIWWNEVNIHMIPIYDALYIITLIYLMTYLEHVIAR